MKCLKMGTGIQALNLLAVVFLTVSCSTLRSKFTGEIKDSTLTDLNPPPAVMTPPHMDERKDLTIDPTYLRSQADYHFTLGEAYSLEGKGQKAIEEFKLTLVYDPESVLVKVRLASEYLRMGQASEALEQAESAVKGNPNNTDARFLLGGIYTSLKMFDQALEQYQELIKINPEEIDAKFYVGAIMAEQKKFAQAVSHFVALAEQAPESDQRARAWYYVARLTIEQDDPKQVKFIEKAFTQALSNKTDNIEILISYAVYLKSSQREAESIRLLESYQRQNGPDKEVAKYLSRHYLDKEDFEKAFIQLEIVERFEKDNLNARIQLALILIEQQRFDEAAVRLEDILLIAPELDKIRYYLGAVYEQTNRRELSIKQYLMVPPQSTYYADAMIHAAYLHKQAGNLNDAKSVINMGIKERDDIAQFYAFYASLLDDTKEYKKAAELLGQAVNKFPTHTQLRFFLGSVQDRLGNTKETVVQMKRVLELDENHVQAMNYLAYTYAEINENLDEAESLARKALSISPNDGYILDTVGWVLFKKGQLDESIRFLEAAHLAKADEAVIAEHLGDAYMRSEMIEKALEMYKKAATHESDVAKQLKIKQKIANIDGQYQKSESNTASRKPASMPSRPARSPSN